MCRDVSADGVGVEDAFVFLKIALCLPKGTYEIRGECLFETESRTTTLGVDLWSMLRSKLLWKRQSP